MRFINTTGNSVTLADVNVTVPYIGDSEQEIDTDVILRSKGFQSLVVNGHFLVTEVNGKRIERNLQREQDSSTPEAAAPPTIEVVIKGHFHDHTGYAKANLGLVYALNRAGVRVCIETIKEDAKGMNEFDLARIGRFKRQPKSPKAIYIHSAIPTFAQRRNGYCILNTTVETSSVPDQFVAACSMFDEIWTPSQFCAEAFRKAGVATPIAVIPNAVDPRVYNEAAKPINIKPALKSYVFVSVLSWTYRKGYDALIKAYLTEFTEDDDVSLLLVSNYTRDAKGQRRFAVDAEIRDYMDRYTGQTKPAHIARCGQSVGEMEMPRLYKACNCFVLPSRGEGFGLPYVEAAMCGLPVVATNYSGHTMFLNSDNAFLLDIDRLAPIEAGTTEVHYWDGQVFPQLSDDTTITNLGRLMRHVMTHPDEAKQKVDLLRSSLAPYTLDAVGHLAKARLEEIWNSL
jgi:glycosyltransferase involved in cell wall biosynthesis